MNVDKTLARRIMLDGFPTNSQKNRGESDAKVDLKISK